MLYYCSLVHPTVMIRASKLDPFEKFKDIMLHGHGGITPLAKTLIVPEPNRSKSNAKYPKA